MPDFAGFASVCCLVPLPPVCVALAFAFSRLPQARSILRIVLVSGLLVGVLAVVLSLATLDFRATGASDFQQSLPSISQLIFPFYLGFALGSALSLLVTVPAYFMFPPPPAGDQSEQPPDKPTTPRKGWRL